MRSLVFFVMCFLSLHLFAVPAYPGKIIVCLNNGKTVTISMRGDEYFKYALSEDGYTLLSCDKNWMYAEKDELGHLVPSKFSLTTIEDASDELNAFKRLCPKHLTEESSFGLQKRQRREQRIGVHDGEPVIGMRRALVVLMQYRDLKLSKTHDEFDALFNEEGFSLDNAKGSVKDYYKFASAGQLDYTSDIYGPYTTLNNMRYYGQNSSRSGEDANALELCVEAIRNLPKDIDYSIYDNDHDGIVDNIHIVFAGYGEEAGASSNAIWSHEYPRKIYMKNEVGVDFAGYSCTPELRGNIGDKISNIGVICHELGHALGANDYYDTNYAVEGSYEGTGKWDIMASGSWNDDGRLPPNFNPYVRTHDFGWEKQTLISNEESITLPMHSNNPNANVVYRLNTTANNDYFLLENRQQMDFDVSIPGSGLMIYHVHPNIDYLSARNTINVTNPQGFYPVCASGSRPSSKQYGNINSGECPFPGTRHVTTFSPNGTPSAVAWDGSYSCFSLSGIKQQLDGNIICDVTKKDDIIDDPIIDDVEEMKTVFYDSFETGLTGYNSTIKLGKKGWISYPNGQIVSNTELIPSPSDGKKLLMLFAGKSQAICEAEIIKSGIYVMPNQKYYLSFDVMASNLPTSLTPVFKFWVRDDNLQIYTQTLTDVKEKWEHIEVPFSSACNSIEYGFYGNIYSGGVYVDNVKIQTIFQLNGVLPTERQNDISIKVDGNALCMTSIKATDVCIYTISGQLIERFVFSEDETKSSFVPSGIYIVKTSNGGSCRIIVK